MNPGKSFREIAAKMNILLAEDDDVVATIVAAKLEREGFKVHRASDGEAALLASATGRYALFIFDVKMPGMDGFDLLARIKENPDSRETPVLMLTGKNSSDNVRIGIQLGADDYMVKPFLPYELAKRVRILIERKHPGGKG